MKLLNFLVVALFFSSCGNDIAKGNGRRTSGEFQVIAQNGIVCTCPSFRSPVCDMDRNISIDNSCIAQCIGVNYKQGPCSSPQSTSCNNSSGSVCGQPQMQPCPEGFSCQQVMPAPITYSSECEMQAANAAFISNGNCPENLTIVI